MQQALLKLLEEKDFSYITVSEVCKTSKVSRSAFYLHYDNTSDLLEETVLKCGKDFFKRFEFSNIRSEDIKFTSIDDLYLINGEYLRPFFEYIRENILLFKAFDSQKKVFDAEGICLKLYKDIFSPILDKFSVKREDQIYIMDFYLTGVMSIVKREIKEDCKRDIDDIIKIVRICIHR